MDAKEEKSLVWYARALFLGFCGLTLLFFHFGLIAGILFFVTCLWCTRVCLTSVAHLRVSIRKFVLVILLYPLVR